MTQPCRGASVVPMMSGMKISFFDISRSIPRLSPRRRKVRSRASAPSRWGPIRAKTKVRALSVRGQTVRRFGRSGAPARIVGRRGREGRRQFADRRSPGSRDFPIHFHGTASVGCRGCGQGEMRQYAASRSSLSRAPLKCDTSEFSAHGQTEPWIDISGPWRISACLAEQGIKLALTQPSQERIRR